MIKKYKGQAAVISAGILWGIISIFVKQLSSEGLTPLQSQSLRTWIAAVVLFVVLLITKPALLKIDPKDIWMFVGTGILSLTFFSRCYFTVVVESGASTAVVLLYTSPIFVMIMSLIFFKEKITKRKIAALIITFSGCVLVSGLIGNGVKLTPRILLVGLGSGFGYGLYSIFARPALKKYNSITVTFYTILLSGISLLFLCRPLKFVVELRPVSWLWACCIAVICTVLPYIAYTYGLDNMDTGKAATLVAIEPLVGALLGIIAFKEDSSPLKMLGMALILVAVVLLNLPEKVDKAKNNKI